MSTTLPQGNEPILLAFSGGLDTSFLVPWLTENYKRPIITVTVDTGGIDAEAAKVLDQRARALGAKDHILVEAKQDYFEQVIKYLIMGNVKSSLTAAPPPATTRFASKSRFARSRPS
jgi:argininosuccinate synthase